MTKTKDSWTPNKRAVLALGKVAQRWKTTPVALLEHFNNNPSQAFWCKLSKWATDRKLDDYAIAKAYLDRGHENNPMRGQPRVPSDPERWLPSDIVVADELYRNEHKARMCLICSGFVLFHFLFDSN
jgi:hypothetical protein